LAKTLTQKRVEAMPHGDARREVPDGGQPGLYLVVQAAPSSAKSWAVRYRHHGRPRKATLGAFPAVDLIQARKLAQAALRAASEGEDPAGDKVAKRTATTIDALWEEYRDGHMADRRDATAAAAATLFENDVLPKWGKRSAETIRRRDVMTLLDGMRDEPAKAIKAKARLHHFFGWCAEREVIDANPVANVKTQHKAVSRERALTDAELRRVWNACDKVGVSFGAMVRVLILTLARRNEVAQMPRAELSESLWSIDGSRTKNGRAMDVHRTAAFNAVIESLPFDGPYVFEGRHHGKPLRGFSDLKARLDEAIGEGMAPWRLHDLRRTGSTIMQRLGIRPEVIDACQNHLPQGIKRVYQRHQYAAEKAQAFEKLAAEVLRIVEGRDADSNVVPMTRPAA
jgi:hypothetical protein